MNPLRIGIIVDDPDELCIGASRLIEGICADQRFRLVNLFSAGKTGGGLFDLAMRVEGAIFSPKRKIETPAFDARKKDVSIVSLSGNGARERGAGLDVAIDLSGSGVQKELFERARFGLWRLTSFSSAAGFWETHDGTDVTVADLIQCGKGTIASAAYNVKFVASRNAAFIREKSVQLVLRELVRLTIDGDIRTDETLPPEKKSPNVFSLIPYGFNLFLSLFRRGVRAILAKLHFRPGMWALLIGKGDNFDFDPSSGKLAAPAENQYWADPFLFRYKDQDFVFFENYVYETKTGHISVGKLEDGKLSFIGDALKTEVHLSFPFVFRNGDDIFMIPETARANRIELWRCIDFPLKWTLHGTALEGVTAADSVLTEHEGQYWLFTNITNDSYGDHCSELHLFSVSGPDLKGATPHPLNPVVIDSRSARGGGRVFSRGGRLYRIAQDNSHGEYGYGLKVMEILRLDMNGYEEKIVRRITPDFDPSLMGVHHLDTGNGIFVLDVRKKLGGLPGHERR